MRAWNKVFLPKFQNAIIFERVGVMSWNFGFFLLSMIDTSGVNFKKHLRRWVENFNFLPYFYLELPFCPVNRECEVKENPYRKQKWLTLKCHKISLTSSFTNHPRDSLQMKNTRPKCNHVNLKHREKKLLTAGLLHDLCWGSALSFLWGHPYVRMQNFLKN